ncbi:hypothetical protein OHB41_25935 [Streptomyces sp. NBC_01571]|uniref:hypothetical protein n=1 Tax=Streptomyces sp. NBC_01571 TaxID=2975883 RepID=UPI002255709C|nr:hypothetical protein [Streptomyces sp. NBC_01571]MCX4576552.1 hypothetical protein [Streptomyces sp. NBC_01571]
MSLNEIQLLIIGMGLGVVLMNLLHMRWDEQSRRSTAASRAARKQATADLFYSGFRLYRLRNRSRV